MSLTRNYIFAALSAVILPAAALARDIEIQGIRVTSINGVNSGCIIAKVNKTEEQTIKNVEVKKWHMPTGHHTVVSKYKLPDSNHILADIDYTPGDDYYYSLHVTLSDDTEYKTDMYNESYTVGACWADEVCAPERVELSSPGNIQWAYNKCLNYKSGDSDIPIQIHPNSTFAKGLSMHTNVGNGRVTLNVTGKNEHEVPFTTAKFTIGLQAYKPDGNNTASTSACRLIFFANGAETGWKGNMQAYSRAGRGTSAYYFDCSENRSPYTSIGLQAVGTAADDIGNLGALRFLYNVPAPTTQAQTISFETPGGTILRSNPEVTLTAYSSSGAPVIYSIAQGEDLATLDGNVLRPIEGKSGSVVVEAYCLGDDEYAPGYATQCFNFNFGPSVEHVYTHQGTEDTRNQIFYLYAEPQGKQLEKLTIDLYDNVRSFTKIQTIDLIADGLDKYAVAGVENLYAVPVATESEGKLVHRLTYKFSGEDEVAGRLSEAGDEFVYLTDMKDPANPANPAYDISVGWSRPFIDEGYEGGGKILQNANYIYAKGFGVHAAGRVETKTTVDLTPFSRFAVDVGGHKVTNTTRGRVGFLLYNGISQAYYNTGNITWDNVYEWDFPLENTAAGKTVKVEYTNGGDGATNDVCCIGAPRFYYHRTDNKTPQTLDWTDEEIINNYTAFRMPLQATTTSGLQPVYRLIKGGEYAKIENGNTLYFYQIPSEGEVVIEAVQPGDKEYSTSNVRTCSFHIRRAAVINSTERMELLGGHDIDELVICANSESSGQAVVKDGIVNVKKLVLKYTFRPGEWNFVSFPSDLDLNATSNLAEKGFTCAAEEGTNDTYILREYNSEIRSKEPTALAWTSVTSGQVVGQKGYIMKLESNDNKPVEITFNIDNVALDFSNKLRSINLSIDLSECEPETRHTVYIRPANVKGNTLRVDMRYVPMISEDERPLNHAKALEEMRITQAPEGGSIRLTLPEQTPARVGIYDKKGKRLLKAVNYVSPMKIDVSDLKRGTYRLIVLYGPASTERLIKL